MGVYTCVSWALMADAIDYNEWKTGKREEGTVYSLHSFFRKLAQACRATAGRFFENGKRKSCRPLTLSVRIWYSI